MAFNTDRLQQIQDLVISQYGEKPVLNNIAIVIALSIQNTEGIINDLFTMRSINNAFGVQLDIIGEILGYGRPFVILDNDNIFTLENPSNAGAGFNEGRFIGTQLNGNFTRLEDSQYKNRLRAQIIKNSATGTTEDILKYLNLLYPENEVTLTIGTGFVDVEFAKFLPSYEIAFVETALPVAAGIKIRNVTIASN